MTKPRMAYKLKSPSLCFLGNGTVPVVMNIGCNTTIYNADLQEGTSSLMDYWWHCGDHLYLQLPPQWKGLCTVVTMHTPSMVIPEVNISKLHEGSGRGRPRSAMAT